MPSLGADLVVDHTGEDFVEAVLAATDDVGADVVYDLSGGDFVERSWRCTARGGRYLAVGFADDDDNGMTGRPLRMACIGNIDIVGVMLAWVDGVDPGMRRFGFNPFGRDVADEIHADLLRLAAEGAIRPVIGRRVTMEEAGAALDEHEARRSLGRTVVEVAGDEGDTSTTPGATRSSAALRCAPSTGWARAWPDRGSTFRRSPRRRSIAAAAKAAGSDDFGGDSFREPLEVFLAIVRAGCRTHHVRSHPHRQDAGRRRWPTGSSCTGGHSTTPRWATSGSKGPGSSWACPGPAPACCRCSSGSIRWPGRCCSGRPPIPSRPRPWTRRGRIPASPGRPRSSTA